MNDMIRKMQEQGLSTAWYKRPDNLQAPETTVCSRLSLYLLKGEDSYTVNHDGSKHLFWKKLKAPVAEPAYFCSGCHQSFIKWDEALNHSEVKRVGAHSALNNGSESAGGKPPKSVLPLGCTAK